MTAIVALQGVTKRFPAVIAIDPAAITGALSLGEQQQVEIMRALWGAAG